MRILYRLCPSIRVISILTLDINIDGDGVRAAHGVPRFTGVRARVFPGDGAEADLPLEAEDVILSLELHCTWRRGRGIS